MARKIAVVLAMLLAVVFSAPLIAEEAAAAEAQYPQVKVGGHIKITLFDRPVGASYAGANKVSNDAVNAHNTGIGFKELNIFLSGKLSETIGFEADPKFSGSTGATPRLGSAGTLTYAAKDYSFSGFGHGKAVVIAELPYEVTAEAGFLHTVFTADYGKQLAWENLFNLTKFGANDNIGSVHGAGLELAKTFNLGDVSLPVAVYFTDGGAQFYQNDNNNQPGLLVHIEPTWAGLTGLASWYGARTGLAEKTAFHKWTAGLMYEWEMLAARAEFVRSKNEKGISVSNDAEHEGYYVNLDYRVLPWLKLFARRESVIEEASAGVWNRYITNIPGAVITVADGALVQFQCDIYDWRSSNGVNKVIMTRPTVGMRLTY